jgi:hypothetical protein
MAHEHMCHNSHKLMSCEQMGQDSHMSHERMGHESHMWLPHEQMGHDSHACHMNNWVMPVTHV